jgi:hypothetical protein
MLSAKDECWYSKSMCDAVVERERDNETNKNRMSECIRERGRERERERVKESKIQKKAESH